MCGICGVVGYDAIAVTRMNEAMVHRGPDDEGIFSDKDVCLGHVRLSIIDVSPQGHQPMCNEDGSVWIVFNGEIYNFQELRNDLEARGHRFRSNTDTEVLIHLYEQYGDDCVQRLRGMFVFAIWDAPKRRLYVARDRLGIKPFLYQFRNGRLAFASELRALLRSGVVERQLDDTAVYEYFLYGSAQSPNTLVRGVFQLMPGHCMVVSQGRLEIRQYWHLPVADESGDGGSEQDYVEKVKAILQDSVVRHMVSDVPLGAFLSGGIDSSSIVAMMSGLAKGRTTTLSVVFEEKWYDEREFSREIAKKYATQHIEIMVRQVDIQADLPHVFDAMDQPSVDGFNTFIISKVARQSGLTVVLSGLGGDEIFAGYSLFTTLPRIVKISAIAQRLPAAIQRGLWALFPSRAISRKLLKASHSLQYCRDLSASHALLRTIFLPSEVTELMNGGQPVEWPVSSQRSVHDAVNYLSSLELQRYLPNTLLHDTDRMSMAHGLEVRVPFLDHVLVEAVMGMPGRLKVGGGFPKRLLVQAMKEHLPASVYRRPKKGFSFPFDLWLRRELRDYCEAKLSSVALQQIPLLNAQTVRRIWREYLQGARRYTDACILACLSFVNWYERHMIGSQTAPVVRGYRKVNQDARKRR